MVESSSYDSVLSSCFTSFSSEIAETEWKLVSSNASCELSTRFGGDCYKTVKVTGFFPCAPKKAIDFILDPTKLAEYDDTTEGRIELESGANYKVFLTKGKPLFALEPRDMVVLMGFRTQSDGSILIAGTSVEHPNAPQEEGRVRASCEIIGYHLESLKGEEAKSKYTFIARINPRTRLPGMMVSQMVQKHAEALEKLAECLK